LTTEKEKLKSLNLKFTEMADQNTKEVNALKAWPYLENKPPDIPSTSTMQKD